MSLEKGYVDDADTFEWALIFSRIQNKGEKSMQSKIMIVYFSATGTTADAAYMIADITGGKLYEIVPQQAYTSEDLNWHSKKSRSSVEMNNPQSRPALQEDQEDIVSCKTIFIGYPIWWDLAPRIINSFIEKHNLAGKTLIPFATSGGSSINNSVVELRKAYYDLNWQDGRLLNGSSREAIQHWVEGILKMQ